MIDGEIKKFMVEQTNELVNKYEGIRPGNKKWEPWQNGTILDGICRHVASLPRIFKKHQNRRSGFVHILLTANDSIIFYF